MSNQTKLVSIVAPVYNGALYVARFIECLVNQTYKNWQLILVDDGSTDDTVDIISDYASRDGRIILVPRAREPKCANTCRNIGLEKAKGQYIVVFDSDDVVAPFCLKQRVEYMESHPEIDYATFKGQSAVDQGPDLKPIGKYWGDEQVDDVLANFLLVKYPFAVWNNIYKAERIKQIDWDERIYVYQDFDFIVSCILNGLKHSFALSEKPDYFYCLSHNNSVSSNFISEQKFNSTVYLFGKTIARLKQRPNYSFYLKCYKSFYLLHLKRVLASENRTNMLAFLKYYKPWFGKGSLRINYLIKRISSCKIPSSGLRTYRLLFECNAKRAVKRCFSRFAKLFLK